MAIWGDWRLRGAYFGLDHLKLCAYTHFSSEDCRREGKDKVSACHGKVDATPLCLSRHHWAESPRRSKEKLGSSSDDGLVCLYPEGVEWGIKKTRK